MFNGLTGILKSRKGMAALLGIIGVIAVRMLHVDQATADSITKQITLIVTLFIGATAAEDAAHKFGSTKKTNVPPKSRK